MFIVTFGTVPAMSQSGLNVESFFSKEMSKDKSITLVSYEDNGIGNKELVKYKSVTIDGNQSLSDLLMESVMKDAANAKAKEISYKKGELYFGFYSMGGKGKHRRYLLFLNRRPVGKEKTTLIYIEGDMNETDVKELMNTK